jgi:hypothetical protein
MGSCGNKRICNQKVGGSNPSSGTSNLECQRLGSVALATIGLMHALGRQVVLPQRGECHGAVGERP